ncbi:MAG: cyclomaltodextrinase C-terminal domain-containing protein, partial [Bacteroidota bacterium]
ALSSALTNEEGQGSGMINLYHSLANDFIYPDPSNLIVFADNHDMSRFYTQVDEDLKLFKLGIIFTATTRGIPQYFYGTEILKANPDTDDHGVIRSDFPGGWPDDEKNAFTGKGIAEKKKEAQSFMKKLLNWRKNEKVIHTGELTHFLPRNEFYVYFRHNKEKTIMVALNGNSEESAKIDTERFRECLKGRTSGINVLTEEKVEDLNTLKISPKSAVIIGLDNNNPK